MINIIILLAEKHFKCDRVKVIVWTRISILKMKTHYHASAFNGICPLGPFCFVPVIITRVAFVKHSQLQSS